MRCLGYLSCADPLYEYLREDILPRIGLHNVAPHFRVHQVQPSGEVYLYEDTVSETFLIGKFFHGLKHRSRESASHCMEQEFNNLRHLRGIGFDRAPCYVPAPLGCNAAINCILVEEFCAGTALGTVIIKAIGEGEREDLFRKLTALASFLAALHNRTAIGTPVDLGGDCLTFDRILDQLKSGGLIGWGEAEAFRGLKEQWRRKGFMEEDCQVLVHGDPTPANILFSDTLGLIAIDPERMRMADRVFDAGRVAAELKHFFMQYAADGELAEPFIGHFLWEYAGPFPDRERAFRSIVRRVPFYMGTTLLRIARNPWLSHAHRRQLIIEAAATLR